MANVALFARAWIEITYDGIMLTSKKVALFARAWIEIVALVASDAIVTSRPLCEGVD